MPGRWHKEPFIARKYEPIQEYVVASGISKEISVNMLDQLVTPLDGFLGQAYNYDDHGLTEEWMINFRDVNSQASNDEVIRTQIESLLDIMTYQVQDRVCNENKTICNNPVGLGPRLKEVPVWGIDCYTRRMIELVIQDNCFKSDETSIKYYVERLLLPTINEMPPDIAHNIKYSIKRIIEVCDTLLRFL